MFYFILSLLLGIGSLLSYLFYLNYQFCQLSKGTPIEKYAQPKSALLIIDLQRDLTESTGKAIMDLEQTNSIIPQVNQITSSWKNTANPIIYVRHFTGDNWLVKILSKGALQKGAVGSELDPRLSYKTLPKEQVHYIHKHFKDAFRATNLDEVLSTQQVNHLVIMGVDLQHCVSATARAALQRGYQVSLLKDAVGCKAKTLKTKYLEELQEMGVAVKSVDKFLKKETFWV